MISALVFKMWFAFCIGNFISTTYAQSNSCFKKPDGCSLDCKYGYGRTIDGCACICNEPCRGVVCERSEVCLVKRIDSFLVGECVSSIDECLPGISKSQCFVNVCMLSPCSANRTLTCIPDYCGGCFARFFDANLKDVTEECFPFTSSLSAAGNKEGDCPINFANGFCLNTCNSHDDCLGSQLCCSNGCGTVCSLPTSSIGILWPTVRKVYTDPPEYQTRLQTTISSEPASPRWPESPNGKIGECPVPVNDGSAKSCKEECSSDADCPSVAKCCWSGCAKRCAYPEKATACIHLRAAIEQLPGGYILDGWLPTCTPGGSFTSVQCNRRDCWCVDELGFELAQTRTAGQNLDCSVGHSCERFECDKQCSTGFELDSAGCRKCKCLDFCQNVTCGKEFEVCHQLPTQCHMTPPCPPVPKCIPNACPQGKPLGNGLCKKTSDCPVGIRCHQIGFDGHGLCCDVAFLRGYMIKSGDCPPVSTNSGGACAVECQADENCGGDLKCCYNGCGLSCMKLRATHIGEDKPGQCPVVSDILGPCLHMCRLDADCPGQAKCCIVGCSKRCLTPRSGEFSSIHPSISTQTTNSRTTPRTSTTKKTTVRKTTTTTTPTTTTRSPTTTTQSTTTTSTTTTPTTTLKPTTVGTSTMSTTRMSTTRMSTTTKSTTRMSTTTSAVQRQSTVNRNRTRSTCPDVNCGLICPYGLKKDSTGCEICQCEHPCDNLLCLNAGEVCLMLRDQCPSEHSICHIHPICVQNVCPTGKPFVDGFSGSTVQCDQNILCPRNSWCQNVGLGSKGICCPYPIAVIQRGKCPIVKPNGMFESGFQCGRSCKSDGQCQPDQKCCFTQCGYLACSVPEGGSTLAPYTKRGECPQVTTTPGFRCTQECYNDFDCQGARKCCQVGCSTVCSLPSEDFVPFVESTTELITSTRLPTTRRTTSTRIPTIPLITNAAVTRGTSSTSSSRRNKKVGMCPKVSRNGECASDISTCSYDRQCPGIKKCCFDGCARRCLYSSLTTVCLHLRANMEKSNLTNMLPECRGNGKFKNAQCVGDTCWCVTEDLGMKIPGTLNKGKPSCSAPRLCSLLLNCTLRCEHGYELDNTGCPICACNDPCHQISCPNPIDKCMLSPIRCYPGKMCPPQPKCDANVCPEGNPVSSPDNMTPLRCRRQSDCPNNNWCQLVGTDEGFCCTGLQPQYHPGECPRILHRDSTVNCERMCKIDSDCNNDARCCFNGCGMECERTVAEFKEFKCPVLDSSVLLEDCMSNCQRDTDCPASYVCCQQSGCKICLPGEKDIRKVGQCMDLPKLSKLECSKIDTTGSVECSKDLDCAGIEKCCQNECALMRCSYPQMSTSCLHYQATAEMILKQGGRFSSNGYLPKCIRSSGSYKDVQCSNVYCWCVDFEGIEIPGSRMQSIRPPDCSNPRPCPNFICNLNCPYGYDLDQIGCEACACYDPCKHIRCPYVNQICRIFELPCLKGPCIPTPRCIANVCPSGDPLRDPDDWLLKICKKDTDCPSSHYCVIMGQASSEGHCCMGSAPLSNPGQCLVSPLMQNPSSSLCIRRCTNDVDCPRRRKCCFNGCSTGCIEVDQNTVKQTSKPAINYDKVGVCPTNPISNPGCRTDCQTDADCKIFSKCCPFGCGRQCQLPSNTTACVHLATSLRNVTARFIPACEPDSGLFVEKQCNLDYCWCVVPDSGLEVMGTRTPKFASLNCRKPKNCRLNCQLNCPHGYELEDSGCPVDGICKCYDPCKDIACKSAEELCILQSVDCISGSCPPVPKCKPHLCQRGFPLKDPITNVPVVCSDYFADQCGDHHGCKISTSSRSGFCCPMWKDENNTLADIAKMGYCAPVEPSEQALLCGKGAKTCTVDTNCGGQQKCCGGCCQNPFNTTNCLHMISAIEDLLSVPGTSNTVFYVPVCDSRAGMFQPVQCALNSPECWCVDTTTGKEIQATRELNTRLSCRPKILCPVMCHPYQMCPFGHLLDNKGCPMKNCSCYDPCMGIKCNDNEVCSLVEAPCTQAPCMPIPKCMSNHCSIGAPIRNPFSLKIVSCTVGTQCPIDHFCQNNVCCHAPKVVIDPSKLPSCDFGKPLEDISGRRVTCHMFRNNCVDAYACVGLPGETLGLCCPLRPSSFVPRYGNTTQQQTSTVTFRLLDRPLVADKDAYRRALTRYLNSFGVDSSEIVNINFTREGTVAVELKGPEAKGYVNKLNDAIDKGIFVGSPSEVLSSRPFTVTTTARTPNINIKTIRINDAVNGNTDPTTTERSENLIQTIAITKNQNNSTASAQPAFETETRKERKTESKTQNNSAMIGLYVSCAIFVLVAIIALTIAVLTLHRRRKRAEGVSKLLLDSYRPSTAPFGNAATSIPLDAAPTSSENAFAQSPHSADRAGVVHARSLRNLRQDQKHAAGGYSNRVFYY